MIDLPPLPYALDALEPHVSAATLTLHHGKHHAGYVAKLNGLIEGTPLASQSLEDIILATHANSESVATFRNAAQAWNHEFLWQCMAPGGGGPASGAIGAEIRATFGSDAGFRQAFVDTAVDCFGSGWTWLVVDDGKLKIESTVNADVPLSSGRLPLLTCDVWEHAYYLDYQNGRADYVAAFLDHLVNWDFVQQRFLQSQAAAAA